MPWRYSNAREIWCSCLRIYHSAGVSTKRPEIFLPRRTHNAGDTYPVHEHHHAIPSFSKVFPQEDPDAYSRLSRTPKRLETYLQQLQRLRGCVCVWHKTRKSIHDMQPVEGGITMTIHERLLITTYHSTLVRSICVGVIELDSAKLQFITLVCA